MLLYWAVQRGLSCQSVGLWSYVQYCTEQSDLLMSPMPDVAALSYPSRSCQVSRSRLNSRYSNMLHHHRMALRVSLAYMTSEPAYDHLNSL